MEKNINKSLPTWQLLLYFCLIGYTFISTPNMGSIYVLLYARIVQAIELLFFGVLLIQNYRQGIRLHGFNIIILIWWLYYTILTYSQALSIVGLTPCFRCMNILIFLLLGNCYWKDNMHETIRYITIVFTCLIYLNAILIILYPEGLWIDEEWVGRGDPTRYLFGNYNQVGFVNLLGIMLHAIYTFTTKKGYINLLFLIIVSIATVAYLGSMTSTICLCILGFAILFKRMINKHIKLLLILFLIFYVCFFVFIVWHGNSIESISWATRFIENTLSKDTSFSNRTELWANAIYKIKQNPWLGYGVQSIEWNDEYLGGSGPHNLWLMLLLQGGIVLCITFLTIVIYTIRHALKSSTLPTTIGIVSLCISFIMSLFETYPIVPIFLLLFFVYHSSAMETNNKE